MHFLLYLLLTFVPVLGVHDGDTVTVSLNGETRRVRLHGIDAPELKQPWGRASQAWLEQRVLGRDVRLETHGEDRYGRVLAVLWLGPANVNQDLVRQGYAWWFQRYSPSDTVLAGLQDQARRARRGLWGDPSPTAPWDFRRARRERKGR